MHGAFRHENFELFLTVGISDRTVYVHAVMGFVARMPVGRNASG